MIEDTLRIQKLLGENAALKEALRELLETAVAEYQCGSRKMLSAVVKSRSMLGDKENAMSGTQKAISDIFSERIRQQEEEEFTAEHDDKHAEGQLASAGAVYALCGAGWDEEKCATLYWPWHPSWMKTGSKRRCLVKAAALIVAEIERMDRSLLGEKG